MPSKIQNRYPSLRRELDLKDPYLDFELQDEVLPVVLLHEHCEGEAIYLLAEPRGATAAGDIASATSAPLRAGAYQITATLSIALAVALGAGVFKRFGVVVWSNGVRQELCRLIMNSNGLTRMDQFLIPKLHLNEGDFVAVRLGDALLANDAADAQVVIQPV